MAMLLKTLVRGITYKHLAGSMDIRISGVENNSKEVFEDNAFVCILGAKGDGHKYIPSAIAGGATCIIVDTIRSSEAEEYVQMALSHAKNNPDTFAVLEMTDNRKRIAELSANYFSHPEGRLDLIGVTGTKGKTTTTYMIYDIMRRADETSGLIGTVNNIIGDKKRPAHRTTPEAFELFELFEEFAKADADSCVMEVSSLGLKQDRVHGLRFDVACFTNLYEDHIAPDEHPDMQDYLDSKLKIFDSANEAIINKGCAVADKVIDYASTKGCQVFTYGFTPDCDIYAKDLKPTRRNNLDGTSFNVLSPWFEGELFVSLPGEFNVENALCAIGVAGVLKVPFETIREAFSNVFVPGRTQLVPNELGATIVVDYAHNGASLESVISSLKKDIKGKTITVFGCGGQRAVTRRVEMAHAASRNSDISIITSDNPRNEDPMKIIDDIARAMDESANYVIEPDRRSAILMAIDMAEEGDLVIIAGKGHEDYQEICGVRHHFDDFEEASKAVKIRLCNTVTPMFSLDELTSSLSKSINLQILSASKADSRDIMLTGVSKDSRTIKQGDLYVALVGEKFDGHDFIKASYEAGSRVMVISDTGKLDNLDKELLSDCTFILVEDTLITLGKIASIYREILGKHGTKVIAVTGSVGKTTTREMITCGLSRSFVVSSTKANQNNEIGMPMTILETPIGTDVLVLEMGMRLRGEISYLSNIAKPDIAVITNIGYSHIERLGSREGIRNAKLEILEGLRDGGAFIYNGEDDMLVKFVAENEAKLLSRNITLVPVSMEDLYLFNAKLQVQGVQYIRNSLVALNCAKILGASIEGANEALAEYTVLDGRGQTTVVGDITIINDAYNAAPESMELAFDNLSRVENATRKIMVLGGMLELGDFAPMLHKEVGRKAAKVNADIVLVTGDNKKDFIEGVYEVNPSARIEEYENTSDIEQRIGELASSGDVILFKASNSFGFEKIAKNLIEKINRE